MFLKALMAEFRKLVNVWKPEMLMHACGFVLTAKETFICALYNESGVYLSRGGLFTILHKGRYMYM